MNINRRTFLTGAGAVVAAAASGAVLGGEAAGAAPGRGRPVIRWELVGGFVPAGFNAVRAPQLVIYADGFAVVDAQRYARLSRSNVDALRRLAVRVLRNPANGVLRPGVPIIADAPATRFETRANGRTYAIQAEALDFYRDNHGYPQPIFTLLDAMDARRERVLDNGRGYRPDAVRLVAVELTEAPADIVDWPAGVPVPTFGPDAFIGEIDLFGPVARRTVQTIERSDDVQWTTFRTVDGTLLSASWRRLLPHEW